MEATPERYRAAIAHTQEHIARIDAMLPSRDGYFAWDQAQGRRARLLRQLVALEEGLVRAETAWAARAQTHAPLTVDDRAQPAHVSQPAREW